MWRSSPLGYSIDEIIEHRIPQDTSVATHHCNATTAVVAGYTINGPRTSLCRQSDSEI